MNKKEVLTYKLLQDSELFDWELYKRMRSKRLITNKKKAARDYLKYGYIHRYPLS